MSNPERIGSESLATVLENFRRTLESNPLAEEPEREKKSSAKIIQLPFWPEPVRGMPNPVLRSALFPAIQSKDRRFINFEKIASVNGIEIRFKGEQLNQEDLEVCAQVFHLAHWHPETDICHTSAHGLLKALRRSTGRTNHQQLHASLIRLQQPLEIKISRYRYSGSLIEKGIKDELTRHYVIKINRDLASLFHTGWTRLDTEQRHKLRGKSLALWLHAFYTSHAEPYSYKVETLRDLSGSRTASLRRFRAALRVALAELQKAGGIVTWDIDPNSDLVRVDKAPVVTARRKSSKN